MKKNDLKKILDHPDREEIIGKLVLDYPAKDIHDWLAIQYNNVNDKKFIISEKSIKIFKDNYLDVYSMIREDMINTKQALATNTEQQLELAVQNSSAYKGKMLELAGKELDVRAMVAHLCVAVETRLGQVFDEIQEDPRNINTKIDRVLIDYAEMLGGLLEKYYKFTEGSADLVIQHNVTLQAVDQHISVFHDVIKEILSHLDLESSMLFMELFNEKMSQLKMPVPETVLNTDMKLAEAKILNETINKKLNE
ncbi:MAG TPA: hypothetical protein VII94_02760 [Candidatus Saccharimonadales bacterium]